MSQPAAQGLSETQRAENAFFDRYSASRALPELDYLAVLNALRSMLHCHARTRTESDARIEALSDRIRRTTEEDTLLLEEQWLLEDQWLDEVYTAPYVKAAHSLAAVAMLASLYETVFCRAFKKIHEHFGETKPADHERRSKIKNKWKTNPKNKDRRESPWNCKCYWDNEEGTTKWNIAKGIHQLAEAINLFPNSQETLAVTLEVLFRYRNAMAHKGIEWPVDERNKFMKDIPNAEFKKWFATEPLPCDKVRKEDVPPCLFYMTDEFIKHCITTLEACISGIGAYCEKHVIRRKPDESSDDQASLT